MEECERRGWEEECEDKIKEEEMKDEHKRWEKDREGVGRVIDDEDDKNKER